MKLQLIGLAVALTFSTAVAKEHSHDHSAHGSHEEKSEKIAHKGHKMTPEMKAHFQKAYDQYLVISESLAKDEFKKAKAGVMSLMENAKEVSADHKKSKHYKAMMMQIHSMHGAKNIQELRDAFKGFSDAFLKKAKAHKAMLSNELNVFYCPMAKGRWAQSDSEIKNPYYGASMLKCGGLEK